MIPSKIRLAAALLALVACRDEPEPKSPTLGQVLPHIPLPPEARLVERRGGTEAIQLTLMTPVKADEVETYYRALLNKGRWRLVKDSRDPQGGVVFLAEQDGPPLWVRIRSTDDGVATMVELAGAIVPRDTTRKPDPTGKPDTTRKPDPKPDTTRKAAKPPV